MLGQSLSSLILTKPGMQDKKDRWSISRISTLKKVYQEYIELWRFVLASE
jgi:hypothetical protein